MPRFAIQTARRGPRRTGRITALGVQARTITKLGRRLRMFRSLLRLILIVVVLVAVGAFFLGYRWAAPPRPAAVAERPIGTRGTGAGIDTSRARAAGAEVGEKV